MFSLQNSLYKSLLFLFATSIAISSCEVSTSTKEKESVKIYNKDLSFTPHGLNCTQIIAKVGNREYASGNFSYGDYLEIEFMDVYDEKNKSILTSFELTMQVADSLGNILFEKKEAKLIVEESGSRKKISTNIQIGAPINTGSSFTLLLSLHDTQSDIYFTSQLEFKVVPAFGLTIDNKGISAKEK